MEGEPLLLANLGWDDPFSSDLRRDWETCVRELPTLAHANYLLVISFRVDFRTTVHAFCDASESSKEYLTQLYDICLCTAAVLRQFNLVSRRSATRVVRQLSVRLPESECNEMTMVKVKFEAEEAPTCQESRIRIEQVHLHEDSNINVGLRVKEENGLIFKTEDEADEVAFKHELEIEPTMLQPKTVPRSHTPLISSQTKPPDLRLSTASADGAAPTPPCSVFVRAVHVSRTEVKEDHCGGYSGVPSHSDFLLDVRRGKGYQGASREQTSDLSDSEGTSVSKRESGQYEYCMKASTESDHSANSIKTTADMHTSIKQIKCKQCQQNTVRGLNLIKHKNIICTHTESNSYENKQGACGTSQVGSFKILTHKDRNLYRCEHCDYGSSEIRNLRRHMRIHTGIKPYKCKHCDYSSSQTWNLKVHIRTHTGEKPFNCKYCEYSSSQLDHLKAHMRTHTGEKPYRCEHCDYSSSRMSTLKTHMHTHTGEKPYRCENCEYSASLLSRLKKHMRTHTGEKPYRCEHCDYSSSEIGNLKSHMRTHTGEKPYRCDHCEYSASLLSHLKTHMRTHTGEKPFRCEHCDFGSSEISNLKRHMRTHTGEKPYRCEHCEYSASELSHLKIHMRTHTGEKPYKCEHCEYSASQSWNLKVHKRTHTGEKPYKCKYCEYSASGPGPLKIHTRTHTGEKPYKCKQCEYSACQLRQLKIHMCTHTGEKPYKCDQCEYSTSRPGDLKVHIRTHASGKQYKCGQCEYSSSRRDSLKLHVHTHTGEKT